MATTNNAYESSSAARATEDVAIIGGGLAGLTAAALVAREGLRVRVYERQQHAGGLARSVTKDGFTFNQGPHALYQGGSAERVLSQLGVALTGGQPKVEGYVTFEGRTHVAPAGPTSLLRTSALGVREKVAMGKLLAGLPKVDPSTLAGTSVSEWVDSVSNSDRVSALVHALVRLSTYSNDPDVTSADVAVAQLSLSLQHGVRYLDNGWQTMVDQLCASPGVEVVTGATLDDLPDVPAVIVAAGGPGLCGTLVSKHYSTGPAADISCVDLGLSRAPEVNFMLGGDEPMYFSNHSAVAKLAPEGAHLVSVGQYLRSADEPDADAMDAFAAHAGVGDDCVLTKRRLHRMTACSALPSAETGGMAGRPQVADTGHRNVFLAGDWVGPTGHLADAAVASAEVAAERAVRSVKRTGAANAMVRPA